MPHLENWDIVYFPGEMTSSLTGVVTNHPKITDGHRIISSALRELDGISMTARTANNIYTLGKRVEYCEDEGCPHFGTKHTCV